MKAPRDSGKTQGGRLLTLALLFLLFGAAARSQAPASPEGAGLDHIRLQLKWLHQFQFAGYYAAKEQGYYRQAGLDVEFAEARQDRDPFDEVLSGRAEYGVGTSELMRLRAEGKPVVVLAVIYQHSPQILLARADAGVQDLHDLVGKPIMVEPGAADVEAYFKNEGLDRSKLDIRPHTFDVRDLVEKRVAAMTGYSTDEPFTLREMGRRYLIFTPRAGGIDFYGDNLFTTQKEIRLHPARARAFREASLRGWNYALAHPGEVVDLILRQYSTRQSREKLLFEAEETRRLMHPDLIEVGYMNPGRWRNIAETYVDLGMIPASFSMKGFLYDPNPQPDLRWVYWLLVGLGVVTFAAVAWIFPLLALTRKLQRAKEAAEAADAAKTRYLAVMSHEVRTSVTGLAGLSRFVLDEDTALSGETRESLGMMESSAQSLLQMVNELLDWARVEAGAVEIEEGPVDLGRLLRELCVLYRPAAEAKGVLLGHTLGEGTPSTVLSDALRLRQILSNLISNAIKFTSKGTVSIAVDLAAGVEKPAAGKPFRLRFLVRDSGIGLSPEAVGRLFAPYAQADASVSRRFGGTGLGLSISLQLARLLGGGITVDSREGAGSVFVVEIEAKAA